MLLHDYTFVPVPAELICARIAADHGEWLTELAAGAAHEGESLRLRVGPIDSLPMLSETVTLNAGESKVSGETTVVRLIWLATDPQGTLPVLKADLEVAALNSEITELTLRASYKSSLEGVDERPGRLAIHRIAEATVRSFMRRLADSLTKTTACPPEPARGTHGHGSCWTATTALT